MALDCVLSTGGKKAEYLIDPIGRQFGYLVYYNTNLESLRNQVKMLEERRDKGQLLVNEAKRKGEVIGPEVEVWMERVVGPSSKANHILDERQPNKECLNGWCPNLKSRHSISRKAKMMAEEVAKLHGDGNVTRVSYPAPPLGIESRPIDGIKCFESRSLILK
ncbi:uncharacterized protein LOC131323744 [Rhododendron vialii]|uniref:uncharacterized protein LOC131323744 n=1 Tax=Rhododendron vialii TaxID=182163 RepID=UPI00265FAA09|nr:uncharacterized protein LOC131323744 [Rhododendron vialii]